MEDSLVPATAEVSTSILDVIPKGNTVIHHYPSKEQQAMIWRRLMEWAMTRKDKRQPLSVAVALINDEFPALDLTTQQANYAIEAFVCPAMVRLMPDVVKRGLMQAGVDLDTTTAKLRRAQKLLEMIDEMERIDVSLRDVIDGKYEKWSENYSKLNKSWLALVESGETGLERFNIIPAITKKVEMKKEERRIDIKGTLDRLGLNQKQALDADFTAGEAGSG